jgi:hypothetical protein
VYAVDPRRTDLAAAFRARPFGPHTGEVVALVTALRMTSNGGRLVLLAAADGQSWELARLQDGRYALPQRLGEHFDDLAQAEWAVFRRRWEAATGTPLDLP